MHSFLSSGRREFLTSVGPSYCVRERQLSHTLGAPNGRRPRTRVGTHGRAAQAAAQGPSCAPRPCQVNPGLDTCEIPHGGRLPTGRVPVGHEKKNKAADVHSWIELADRYPQIGHEKKRERGHGGVKKPLLEVTDGKADTPAGSGPRRPRWFRHGRNASRHAGGRLRPALGPRTRTPRRRSTRRLSLCDGGGERPSIPVQGEGGRTSRRVALCPPFRGPQMAAGERRGEQSGGGPIQGPSAHPNDASLPTVYTVVLDQAATPPQLLPDVGELDADGLLVVGVPELVAPPEHALTGDDRQTRSSKCSMHAGGEQMNVHSLALQSPLGLLAGAAFVHHLA